MELKEFIKGVISDITNAVKECQDEIQNGSIVSPPNGNAKQTMSIQGRIFEISHVDFDVAITAETKTTESKEGGAGIKVLSGFIGGKIEDGKTLNSENISQVRFSIPIVLPPSDAKEKKDIKVIPNNHQEF